MSMSAFLDVPSPAQTLKSQVEVEGMNGQRLIDTEISDIYPAAGPSRSCPNPLLKLQVPTL
jgi:hypothetical protein